MRIGFCGTMSVGKTTLVNELSNLPEFEGYEICTERSKYLKDLGIPLNGDSTLKGQTIFLAERCSELIQPALLTDRTVIDVMAFTMLADSINIYQKSAFLQYASQFIGEYDWLFYISPEGTILEDNNVRIMDFEYRSQIDFKIQELIRLNSHLLRDYKVLSGSTQDRIESILQVLSPR